MNNKEQGFTLIELLVVVAIIGVLAGIAIPSYGVYRVLAHDAAAHSDLRNFVTAQEAYFVDYSHYASSSAINGFNPTTGVSLQVSGSTTDFEAETKHEKGENFFNFNTAEGNRITISAASSF